MVGTYALVLWTNSDSTSIVPSTAVCDQHLFSDSEQIGKILAAVPGRKAPGSGWTKHDGRVLCTHDKLNFLKVKENDFIKGDFEEDHEEDQLTGRSHRRPKRFLEDEDSDEFCEEEEASTSKIMPAKKSKRAQAEGIINQIKERQQCQPSVSCSNCRRLAEEITNLKRENLALLKGLPAVVEEMRGTLRSMKSVTSRHTNLVPATRRPPVITTSPVSVDSDSVDSADSDLGGGVITAEVIRKCQNTDFKKMTRDLMTSLFTQEEMSTSSVLGRKAFGAGIGGEARQPLPSNKVAAIINQVRKLFPSIEPAQVRQLMAYKLKDVRKTFGKANETRA